MGDYIGDSKAVYRVNYRAICKAVYKRCRAVYINNCRATVWAIVEPFIELFIELFIEPLQSRYRAIIEPFMEQLSRS
jgi:lysophospholipase L1-like esterase